MLEHIKLGLSKKITMLCLLLAAAICAGVCVSGYFKYRNSTYQTYNEFAYDLADTALDYVDGNTVADYLETGQIDAAYSEMAAQIDTLYRHTNLTSIYICVPDAETMTVTTIYDVRVNEADNPAIYALGAVDPIGSADPQKVVDIYRTGQRSNDYFIRKNSFGYNTSAIVPVLNNTGEVTALLLVDMPMPFIIRNLNEYLFSTIVITALLALLLVGLYLCYLRRKVIAPIRLITESAAMFVCRRKGFSEDVLKIKTGDEIETLAGALAKMEVDITQYIKNLAQVTAEKERISAELDVARHIQASMLPCIFPPFPDRSEFDIYATMTPAKEVGGDFYDFFLVDDNHLALLIADVSGKGVPAALFMVIAKTLLKNSAQAGLSPKAVLEKVNSQLCENNEAEMFVTVWLGVLEVSTGKLICANAGHEYPAIRREGGAYELVKDKHGFVLAGMENVRYQEYELTLNPGDCLFVYTDGVTEATNARNELYGTGRMLDALNRCKGTDCGTLLRRLKEDINTFVGEAPQFDDITMLSLELTPALISDVKKLKLIPTLEAIDEVTAFVENELDAAGAPPKVIAQVNIAADEIFSNIARYSGAKEATVDMTVKNGSIIIRFTDNGRPYDPTERPDPDTTLSAEEREIGGLGIFMVKKSMDTVEYSCRDGLNILTLTKRY